MCEDDRINEKAWNKNAVGTAIIQAIADAFQKVLDIINRLVWDTAQWAGSLNFYPLLNSIKNLFESMSPLIEAIGSFLERLYTNVILPMLKFLIENGLPFLINLLAGLFDFLGEHQWIIDAIGAALLGAFVSSKISPLVLGIRSAITSLIGVFTGAGGLSGAISMIVAAFDRFAVASNVIPLTPDMIKYIEAQRHFWGFKVTNINGYLFCDEKGDPLKEDTIKYEIRQVIKKIRQDGKEFPDITPHVFRHTFATRAIEEGMPPQVLKTIMGHSSLAITMDLYSHVMEDTKQKEMLSIANAF